MKKADGLTDIDELDGWFPTGTSFYSDAKNADVFIEPHSLAAMAYFMFQTSVYDRSNLLHRKTAVDVFHFFFSHFQIVMLEFSYALKLNRYRLSSNYFLMIDGIASPGA